MGQPHLYHHISKRLKDPLLLSLPPTVKLANETISNTTHPAPVAEDEPSAKRSKVAVDTPSTDSDQPRTMPALRLGSAAPDFEAKTTQGPIKFHEWLDNSWAILFSHPADKTPVCTTELGEVAKLEAEWKKRGVKTIGLSCDDLGLHEEWIADINELSNVDLKFPIIADADRRSLPCTTCSTSRMPPTKARQAFPSRSDPSSLSIPPRRSDLLCSTQPQRGAPSAKY